MNIQYSKGTMKQHSMIRTLFIRFFFSMALSSALLAQVPVLFNDPFDAPPVLTAVQAAASWYPDRFPPAVFEKDTLKGEAVLRTGIRLTDAYWNRPTANRSTFYNTQGRKFDLGKGNGFNSSLTADLYVGADWETKHRMATVWSTAADSAGATSFYNIFGFRNSTGTAPGFYMYGYQNVGVYTLLPYTITYGRWYRLSIELTDTAFVYSINGTVVLSDTTLNGTTHFSNIMLQAYSFADSTLAADVRSNDEYDVYWDNVGASKRPYRFSNPAAVDLLSAGDFKVLAGSAVTIGSGTTVNGNIGVSPGTTVTNNGTVFGQLHLQDDASIQAQLDLTTAYTNAAGRTADTTIGSELGSQTLGRGVYTSAAGTFAVTGTLTLTGSATDVFLFQAATTLTTGSASKIVLTGGAVSANVFWQVGSSATIGGDFNGNILALTAITQNIGSTLHGSFLARNSFVTVNGSSVFALGVAPSAVPGQFALAQNYPNPFNPSTTFSFTIPSAGMVTLTVTDGLGRNVVTIVSQQLDAGTYTRQWNAAGMPSGVYFYRLQSGAMTETKKLMLLK
jgi:hypothetical protein